MPTFLRASLLALALCCPDAAAEPVCQYAGVTGEATGDRPLANPCVASPYRVTCYRAAPGNGRAGLVAVICHPEV